MKVAVIYVLIICVVSMIWCQPTHDFDDETDCTCQQLERAVLNLQKQVNAIQEQVKEKPVNEQDVTIPPSIPSRPTGESFILLSLTRP